MAEELKSEAFLINSILITKKGKKKWSDHLHAAPFKMYKVGFRTIKLPPI